MAREIITSSTSANRDRNKGKEPMHATRDSSRADWHSKWTEDMESWAKGDMASEPIHGVSDNEDSPTTISQSSRRSNISRAPNRRQLQPTVEDYYSSDGEWNQALKRAPAKPQTLSSSTEALGSSSKLPHRSTEIHNKATSHTTTATRDNRPLASNSKANLPSPPPEEASTFQQTQRPTVRFVDSFHPRTHGERRSEHGPKYFQDWRYFSRAESPRFDIPSHPTRSWGDLFTDKGEPTPALGRLLRGIANYIIAEYSPIDSLVITPDKLFRFYGKYKLNNEVIPLQQAFDPSNRRTYRGLQFLFADLRCEYHLIQDRVNEPPTVPALTAVGFEDWMTMIIRAFPEREARRLDLIVSDIPIEADTRYLELSNGANSRPQPPEKLPRQISRQLFPANGHPQALNLVVTSFREWGNIISAPPTIREPMQWNTAPYGALFAQRHPRGAQPWQPPRDTIRRYREYDHPQNHHHHHHPEELSFGAPRRRASDSSATIRVHSESQDRRSGSISPRTDGSPNRRNSASRRSRDGSPQSISILVDGSSGRRYYRQSKRPRGSSPPRCSEERRSSGKKSEEYRRERRGSKD